MITDQKKFARAITKMFDKNQILKDVHHVVTDGYLLYRGELKDDKRETTKQT